MITHITPNYSFIYSERKTYAVYRLSIVLHIDFSTSILQNALTIAFIVKPLSLYEINDVIYQPKLFVLVSKQNRTAPLTSFLPGLTIKTGKVL